MKKLIISISGILLLLSLTACSIKVQESQEKKTVQDYCPGVDLTILDKEPVIYSAKEKSWNDFEWLQKIPEYYEKDKIDHFEVQEGDYINIYYNNANLDIVRKWADDLLDLGFYENKLDEEMEDHIAIKRRNLELDLRANPYYYYETKILDIFVNRTEYQREIQDASYCIEQYEKEHLDNK